MLYGERIEACCKVRGLKCSVRDKNHCVGNKAIVCICTLFECIFNVLSKYAQNYLNLKYFSVLNKPGNLARVHQNIFSSYA